MIKDFFNILTACMGYLSSREHLVLVFVAILLGGLCWLLCASYTKLWNKHFNVNAKHHILCGIAALCTIFFIYGFYSVRYLENLVHNVVGVWETNLLEDDEWADSTFEIAFYAVQRVDPAPFKRYREPKNGGSTIPLESSAAIQVCAETYVYEACESFATEYPFLNRLLKVRAGISREAIEEDIEEYFDEGHSIYPAEQAIDLAAWYIESELIAQAPTIVKKTRTVLFLLFLLIQAIPFGIIGYVAYKNLKIKQLYY
jgi:hypothetical protein